MITAEMLKAQTQAALGKEKADLVIKNANILNVFTEEFEKGDLAVKKGVIVGIGEYEGETEIDTAGKWVVPAFIDSHIHLESSVVSPKQYCKAVMPHGTAAIITDPHEITNVLGKTGFYYMLEEVKGLPLDIYFMVPSCVPATPFDESGADITTADIEEMLACHNVLGLAEMMNYPAVLGGDLQVLEKIAATLNAQKHIDGHAPAVRGKELSAYTGCGVDSDHECTNLEEAKEKLGQGQWILIREGTACKNLESLLPLFSKPYCDRCALSTDDKHPGDLKTEGHIDHIVRKAISLGANPVNAYKMASYNAAQRFGLKQRGALAAGYIADFVILDDPDTVSISSVYKNGRAITDTEINTAVNPYADRVCDTVNIGEITPESFALKKEEEKVIGLVPHEILTTDEGYASQIDTQADICKLAVIERHRNTGNIGVAFVKGYGLKRGAVSTTVAHDSHNIIVAGASEGDMAFAVSRLKELKGGMVVVEKGEVKAELSLPIAGLMCDLEAGACEEKLGELKNAAYALGASRDIDPFMTLSFASLAVIPTLRLTTKGVVDVTRFELL